MSLAARQVPGFTYLTAGENRQHLLPQNTKLRQLAGQRGVARHRGISKYKEKQSGLQRQPKAGDGKQPEQDEQLGKIPLGDEIA